MAARRLVLRFVFPGELILVNTSAPPMALNACGQLDSGMTKHGDAFPPDTRACGTDSPCSKRTGRATACSPA